MPRAELTGDGSGAQFVPATWRQLGRDGNGDGIKDPNNMWDATLAAGGYLCESPTSGQGDAALAQ
jgi:membrane-bound lytic murein transglycosylase B